MLLLKSRLLKLMGYVISSPIYGDCADWRVLSVPETLLGNTKVVGDKG